MPGICPKCKTSVTIVVESIRARYETSGKTCPAVQFMCGNCRSVLGVSLDPDWHSQIMGQLKRVESETNQ
jgi:RNase P subunit RPR2